MTHHLFQNGKKRYKENEFDDCLMMVYDESILCRIILLSSNNEYGCVCELKWIFEYCLVMKRQNEEERDMG